MPPYPSTVQTQPYDTCSSSLLTYCHIMSGVEVILWVFRGSKYDCSNVTYISKNNCLCYYFSTSFLQLGVNYNKSIWYVCCIVLYLTQCYSAE
jgi:hypothetical protein